MYPGVCGDFNFRQRTALLLDELLFLRERQCGVGFRRLSHEGDGGTISNCCRTASTYLSEKLRLRITAVARLSMTSERTVSVVVHITATRFIVPRMEDGFPFAFLTFTSLLIGSIFPRNRCGSSSLCIRLKACPVSRTVANRFVECAVTSMLA